MDTKQVAKVVLHKENKVLLLKSAGGEFKNTWDLPGGHIQKNEDIVAGLKREVKEETNLTLSTAEFIGLTHNNKKFYKADLPKGKIKLSSEHNAYKLIKIEDIDVINISNAFKKAIKKTFEDKK